jgi:OOP family OmpA-OmpF porin
MAESVAPRNGEPDNGSLLQSASDRRPPADDNFARLRSIIVGPEQRELLTLRAHLLDPMVQTRDVSRVLPDALQLRSRDPQLMRALAPSIEDAITASVARDPQPLADALFPVIGPAIRKAVAHTFDAMIESLNQAVDRTVSWRAMRWRLVAWRTGRPYAEVVLADTVEYRVEQVFLVQRESGLLLQHVSLDQRGDRDADQVSAMLTAITDFARDSFQIGQSDTLESLRVGDLAVSIAQGPHAIVAAVVRGSIPLSVRSAIENAAESIHRQFGATLQSLEGDPAVFAPARPILKACLLSQQRHPQQRPSYRGWALGALVLLALAGLWMYRDARTRQAWNAYLDQLRSEPGIVVVSAERRGGRFLVSGLRDPLSRDPGQLLTASSRLAPASIDSRWEPYQALNPAFVVARATLLLRPPPGVSLAFADGVLTATGSPSQRWVSDTERIAPAIAGVQRVVFAGTTREAVLVTQIGAAVVSFARGQSTIEATEQQNLAAVVAGLQELDRLLAASGRRARLAVLGDADSEGPEGLNAQLSVARANRVLAVIRSASLQRIESSARGLWQSLPDAGAAATGQVRNRRVSFEIRVTEDPMNRGSQR